MTVSALTTGVLAAVMFLAVAAFFALLLFTRYRTYFRFKQLGTEISLTEQVGHLGYWSRAAGADEITWSAGMYEIWGQDPATFKATSEAVRKLIFPEDVVRIRSLLDSGIVEGKDTETEIRIRWPDGSVRRLLFTTRNRFNRRGKYLGLFGICMDVTARREAEEQLRRDRESLDLAMQASHAGYFDIDFDGGRTYWSPRALEIFGVTDVDFAASASSMQKFVHPEDLPEFFAEIEQLRMRDVPLDVEMRVRHAAGHYVWVRFQAKRESTGQARRVVGIVRDVSAEKLAQRALADSERKFRSLFESSIQGVLIHREFKPLYCNRTYARLLGYDTVDEVLQLKDLTKHVTSTDPTRIAEAWQRMKAGEFDGKFRIVQLVDRRGRRRVVETVGQMVPWEGGPAWQHVSIDVTEREQAQSELKASEERFRLLADNASDVIVLYDETLSVRYVSPSIERLAGYKPEEVVGTNVFDHVVIEDLPTDRSLEDLGRNPRSRSNVFRYRCKDGGTVWVESTTSKIQGPPGTVGMSVVAALRDVTERVEREMELASARDNLKHQADELAELAQNLEAERERAERANAAKSQFLAMMSHELRTPMTGVLGMADLLRLSGLNSEQEELTDLLTRSARVLLDLLNDILDFSKIEAGQLDIEAIPFRVSEIVADVRNLFASPASEKGLGLEALMPPTYWDVVVGDPKRLRQILSNLVNNAIKFTERGRITIRLTQEPAGEGQVLLNFSVTDTGIGMAANEVQKLFQPFVQADVSTSRKYGGTGLGLAICRRLVEGMGGQITVDTVLGEGSTFKFSILVGHDRLARPKPIVLPQQKSESNEGAVAVAVPTARTVLVAEDNETSRYLLSLMLSRLGHAVDTVEDGAKAVSAVKSKAYDIVLMDMQMPVMDGTDATRAIRKLEPPRGKVPIIAITADVVADHRGTYFHAGVNAIVGKPIDWVELNKQIEEQIAAGGVAGPPAKPQQSHKPKSVKPKSANPETPVLDEGMLKGLSDVLGAGTLANMLVNFNGNMLKYRDDLAVALEAGDLKKVKRTAHALKGLCAQFGAVQASGFAKTIEESAADLNDVQSVMPDLLASIVATEQALGSRSGNGEARPLSA